MATDLYEFNHRRIAARIPQLRYKSGDFGVWQKTAREKLFELLGLAEFEKCDEKFEVIDVCDKGDYKKMTFVFQSEEGVFIPCDMLVPKKEKEKYPLMIVLQGHNTGRHVSIGEAKFPEDSKRLDARPQRAGALECVKRGYIAIAMEQRYMGELGSDENGTPDCCKQRCMPTLLLGRTPVGERVWDVSRLIDTVEKNIKNIDCSHIGCMGGSGGGTTTFYAACIDERLSGAFPDVALCTYGSSIAAMHHCTCNYIPGIAKYFDMGDLGGLIAPRRMIMSNGKLDEIFPIAGARETAAMIQKLYTMAGAEENFDFYIGDGGHQAYTADVLELLAVKENEK